MPVGNMDVGDLAVEDVYELASQVGKEFEHTIDTFGPESVAKLMPRVICVLEHLEVICLQKEEYEMKVDEMRVQIMQLEHEKSAKAVNRVRFENDLELIEENWKVENSQLKESVSKLKDENFRLLTKLNQKEVALSQSLPDSRTLEQSEQITEQNLTIRHQEKEIGALKSEVCDKSAQIEKIELELETTLQSNRDLRRRIRQMHTQARMLGDEKAELEADVHGLSQDVIALKEKLGIAVQENVELSTSHLEKKNQKEFIDTVNKPKFSLLELRNLLIERNDLKARVHELEDELTNWKNRFPETKKKLPLPKSVDEPQTVSRQSSQTTKVANAVLSGASVTEHPLSSAAAAEASDSGEEVLLYGPINREPDEKLFPGRKASILRLGLKSRRYYLNH